jgi:hypothetical protein
MSSGPDQAGWFVDPTGRHQHRYFDGESWSEHVADEGVTGLDPPGESAASTGVDEAASPAARPVPDPDDWQATATPIALASAKPVVQVLEARVLPAETTRPAPDGRRARFRRVRRWHLGVAASVLLVASVVLGLCFRQQHSVASQWQQRDRQHLALYQEEVLRLQQTSAALADSKSQVATLTKKSSALATQLSRVANEKAKAIDQNTVLGKALTLSGHVAGELNTCVDDMQTLLTDISAVINLGANPAQLQVDANVAGQDCTTAQTDNSRLQQTLAGG